MFFGNNVNPESAEIEAVIIKADGSIAKLGTIDYYHRNPLKRWAWKIKQVFKRVFSGKSK
jgi:hypothetical protein